MSKESSTGSREGSLEAPTRHPIDWQSADFYDQTKLDAELERVFDICHGCRRCVSLCNAFPTLFDLVDASSTMEVDGVAKSDYGKVVEQCYLCDLCYMTKCPYVPPHPWNVDFPHLMLRAKAVRFQQGEVALRDKVLSSTQLVGRLAGVPVVAQTVNWALKQQLVRGLLEKGLGIAHDAPLPEYAPRSLHARDAERPGASAGEIRSTDRTKGKVVLFATCYGDHNDTTLGVDLIKIFEHNGIQTRLTFRESCCGMPKLEHGDLASVARYKEANIKELLRWVNDGWDVVAPIPSCVLMFKQELPLLFPDDEDVKRVQVAMFDPFEYLFLRHKQGLVKTEFPNRLGRIAYHVPCHQRVQKIGLKTRDVLQLVPETTFDIIERCSGHNGTYAVKAEFHDASVRIGRPVADRVEQAGADHFVSDCPMAGSHVQSMLPSGKTAESPLALLRYAYGL